MVGSIRRGQKNGRHACGMVYRVCTRNEAAVVSTCHVWVNPNLTPHVGAKKWAAHVQRGYSCELRLDRCPHPDVRTIGNTVKKITGVNFRWRPPTTMTMIEVEDRYISIKVIKKIKKKKTLSKQLLKARQLAIRHYAKPAN